MRAADWVQLLLTRTPGHATATISGPDLDRPVRIGCTDGVVYSLEGDAVHGDTDSHAAF